MPILVEKFESKTIRTTTPDGTMFTIIDENPDGTIAQIRVEIGKSGSKIRAWTFAFSQLVSMLIQRGASIEDIITVVSNTNSDKLVYDKTTPIRSGPAGFVQALMIYKEHKFKLLTEQLGDPLKKRRPPRIYGRSA